MWKASSTLEQYLKVLVFDKFPYDDISYVNWPRRTELQLLLLFSELQSTSDYDDDDDDGQIELGDCLWMVGGRVKKVGRQGQTLAIDVMTGSV